jgi:hypothetical protein
VPGIEENAGLSAGQFVGEVSDLAIEGRLIEVVAFENLEPVLVQRGRDVGRVVLGIWQFAGMFVAELPTTSATRFWARAMPGNPIEAMAMATMASSLGNSRDIKLSRMSPNTITF